MLTLLVGTSGYPASGKLTLKRVVRCSHSVGRSCVIGGEADPAGFEKGCQFKESGAKLRHLLMVVVDKHLTTGPLLIIRQNQTVVSGGDVLMTLSWPSESTPSADALWSCKAAAKPASVG